MKYVRSLATVEMASRSNRITRKTRRAHRPDSVLTTQWKNGKYSLASGTLGDWVDVGVLSLNADRPNTQVRETCLYTS
jgi:hypothetical protein